MKAVITGGAGFIGSHLTDRLLDEGYKVTIIDNLSSGKIENIQHNNNNPLFRFVKGDLLNPDRWINEFKDANILFHFAANPEVRHSVRSPLDHYHANLTATINVLEATRQYGINTVVFASSSTVYGDPEKIPTPEDHPLKPISIYGATKAAGEILCETYARLYGIKCLIVRYANIVGPRLTHGVIYDFIQKLQRNPRKLEILGDGTQRKSYLYITDAVEATLTALNHISNTNKLYETYNIGNSDWVTVKEIAVTITKKLNLEKVEYIYKPATQDGRGWLGDVKLMLLDITKIKKYTGWNPKISSKKAISLTIDYILNKPD